MWFGFTVNAISGILLLMANASGMLSNVVFLVKLGLIALAVVNMELLRHRLAAEVPAGAESDVVPSSQVRMLALSSIVLWIAVIISGRLTAYPNFVTGLFS